MIKLSIGLAIAGLALVLASAIPWGAAGASPLAAPALAPPTSVAAQVSDVEYGKALFSAKGCVSCHHHDAIAHSGIIDAGFPDLSTPRWDADFLRKWLHDPSAVRPGTDMPTLNLKDDEIEALIAFLTAGGK